jgi:hypothetical protein
MTLDSESPGLWSERSERPRRRRDTANPRAARSPVENFEAMWMNDSRYAQIYDWDNLILAHRKASRGKRGKAPAASFEYRLEDNLIALHDELRTQTYRPGPYDSFYIHEPKRRLISAAPFRDRVVRRGFRERGDYPLAYLGWTIRARRCSLRVGGMWVPVRIGVAPALQEVGHPLTCLSSAAPPGAERFL